MTFPFIQPSAAPTSRPDEVRAERPGPTVSRRSSARFALAVAVFAALIGTARSADAQSQQTASIPQAFTTATNARDLEALADLFTEDAVMHIATGQRLIGKRLVRLGLEGDLSVNPYDVLVGTPEITPGRAVWVRDHFDDDARSLGVAPLRETVEALLEGSRIRSITFTRSPESDARFQAAQRALDVVLAFEAAQNAGEVEAAVELFADDAVGVTADGHRWVGREQIRAAVQHSWASGAYVERSRYQVAGDRVTSQASVSSDLLRALGIGALQVSSEAVIRDGRIQSTTSTLSPESAARLQAAQNRALANRFVRAFNNHDLDGLMGLFAPEVVNRSAPPGEDQGFQGARAHFEMLFGASTDLSAVLGEIVSERDLLVVRMSYRGTHTGELFGIPATGRQLTLSGIEMWRVQGGKIVEVWGYSDDAGLLRQLGPAP